MASTGCGPAHLARPRERLGAAARTHRGHPGDPGGGHRPLPAGAGQRAGHRHPHPPGRPLLEPRRARRAAHSGGGGERRHLGPGPRPPAGEDVVVQAQLAPLLHGPLAVEERGELRLHDYVFTGWGPWSRAQVSSLSATTRVSRSAGTPRLEQRPTRWVRVAVSGTLTSTRW